MVTQRATAPYHDNTVFPLSAQEDFVAAQSPFTDMKRFWVVTVSFPVKKRITL